MLSKITWLLHHNNLTFSLRRHLDHFFQESHPLDIVDKICDSTADFHIHNYLPHPFDRSHQNNQNFPPNSHMCLFPRAKAIHLQCTLFIGKTLIVTTTADDRALSHLLLYLWRMTLYYLTTTFANIFDHNNLSIVVAADTWIVSHPQIMWMFLMAFVGDDIAAA